LAIDAENTNRIRQTRGALKPRPFGKDYVPKISPQALTEVQSDLAGYCAVVDATTLSEVSKGIYIDFADKFVRWLSGNFAPGSERRYS